MPNFSTTTTAMALSALLLVSAASPAAAAEKRSTTTYSPAVINQALKARQSTSDDEWDECMEQGKAVGTDYIELLGACFCLTVGHDNPACS